MTNFCTFSKYISGRKMNKVQRYDNVALKGHGYDFGQILFFCFYYVQCFRNAFLMTK